MAVTKDTTTMEQEGREWFENGLLLAAWESREQWCNYARKHDCSRLPAALNALGAVRLELGHYPCALELFQEAYELTANSPTVDTIFSLCNLSLCNYLIGATSECITKGEEAKFQSIALEIHDTQVLGHIELVLGLGYIAAEQWDHALCANSRAKAALESQNDRLGVAKTLNNMGLIHVETGNYDEGERLLLESLRVMSEFDDRSTSAYAYTELARLNLLRGDVAVALKYGGEALRTLWGNVGLIDKAEVARLCELFGSITQLTGDRSSALSYMQRATTYYAQLGLWREWQASTHVLEQLMSRSAENKRRKIAVEWEDKQLLKHFTTLLGLMDALESLNPDRRGKAELVTKYALLIGEGFGISHSDQARLAHAARLHDIGCITLGGDEEGTDDGDEYLTHPLLGERMLEMFDVDESVQKAVRHHREWFDGTGGPDGLKGKAIPLFARIIAVAEGYVAHVLQRKDPMNAHTDSLRLLCAQSGQRYDPDVVDAFITIHGFSRSSAVDV